MKSMKSGVSSNVRNLRPAPTGPYDHALEDGIPVTLPEVGWALVHRILDMSDVEAVRDCAEQIAVQMRTHRAARLNHERNHR